MQAALAVSAGAYSCIRIENEKMKETRLHVQVEARFLAKVECAAALELRMQHFVGIELEELSMAQLDGLEEFHYGQLEAIQARKLRIHRALQKDALDAALKLDSDMRAALR